MSTIKKSAVFSVCRKYRYSLTRSWDLSGNYVLFIGLKDSILNQPVEVRGQIKVACWVTIISWSFYPVVYLLPNFGLTGGDAYVGLQVGYSIADIVSKAGFGVLIYIIAYKKSKVEGYCIS